MLCVCRPLPGARRGRLGVSAGPFRIVQELVHVFVDTAQGARKAAGTDVRGPCDRVTGWRDLGLHSCPCAFDAFLLSVDFLDVCVLPLLEECFWASAGPHPVTWKPPGSPGVCAGVVSEVRVPLKPAAAASWTLLGVLGEALGGPRPRPGGELVACAWGWPSPENQGSRRFVTVAELDAFRLLARPVTGARGRRRGCMRAPSRLLCV